MRKSLPRKKKPVLLSGGNPQSAEARWIDIHEDGFDEARLGEWIRQAAAIPGWGKS